MTTRPLHAFPEITSLTRLRSSRRAAPHFLTQVHPPSCVLDWRDPEIRRRTGGWQ